MITKADLFFDTAGTRPILIQLVNTKDGFLQRKFFQNNYTSCRCQDFCRCFSSDNCSISGPVFMQQDTTYALLIKVDQPWCKVYFSELGGSNLGDNRTVGRNH